MTYIESATNTAFIKTQPWSSSTTTRCFPARKRVVVLYAMLCTTITMPSGEKRYQKRRTSVYRLTVSLKRQNRTALDVPCKRQHSFISHIKRPPYLALAVKTLALAEVLMTTCQKWMRHPPQIHRQRKRVTPPWSKPPLPK